MLSVANPPDPPCSRKVIASGSDEKGHTHPSESTSFSPEADSAGGPDEAPQSHFSIRDYVFASRSKDVGSNWPFPQKYLQLCVKHGVRDLLPPLEPPDWVRTRFNGECVAAERPVVSSEVEETQTEVSDVVKHCGSSLRIQESVLASSREHHLPSSEENPAVVQAVRYQHKLILREADRSKVTGDDHFRSIPSSASQFPGSVQETRGVVSESSSEVEVAKPPRLADKVGGSPEPSIKRCRLILKFGGAPELNRTEDKVSSFSSVSDPMASKVCPVCKTFSSTSNTTLNAHIDQCLSAESIANRDATKLFQNKVKPRKKRSMEDICATARQCTLEDLDRRNGTNWAVDLTSRAPTSETSRITESKRPRISPLKATVDEREGAVYVDSNGTKLLILSTFNNSQPAPAADCPGRKKCIKEFKNEKSSLDRKKSFPQKYRKYLKATVQRKKMRSFSHLKREMHREGVKLHVHTHHEEGRISQVSNAPEQMKVGKPGTLGHWICSKLSSLLKHLNSKPSHRKPRDQLSITHQTSMKSDQSASCDYFAREGRTRKSCRSSDEILSPPKSKTSGVISGTAHDSLNQGKHATNLTEMNTRPTGNSPSSSNNIVLKLSRATEKFISSSNTKRVKVHTNTVQKSSESPRMRKTSIDCRNQVRKVKNSSRSLETINCSEVVQGLVSKKLRKHRSAEKSCTTAQKLPLELHGRFHGSPSAHGLSSTSGSVATGLHQTNFSGNVVSPTTSDAFVNVLPCLHNMVDSNQVDVRRYHASEGECLTLNHSQLDAGCHHEVTKSDAQTKMPVNLDSMVKYPLERSDGTCNNEVLISEDHETNTCNRLDSCLSPEHQGKNSGTNKATIIAGLPILLGSQGIYHGDVASAPVCQESCQIGQIQLNVEDGYCSELPSMEYKADVASLNASAGLSRQVDMVPASSVASGRIASVEVHNVIIDSEPSGSPVSTTSTVSHPSIEDLKSGDMEEPLLEPAVIREKRRSNSRSLGLLMNDSIKGTERIGLEKTSRRLKTPTSAQKPEKFWDAQPCCCSRRENIPHKSRVLRQSAMSQMMLPSKAKQITSSLYLRSMISSSGTYSHSISEVKDISILDSPIDLISAKASSDFAMRFPPFSSSGSGSRFGSGSPSSHAQSQNTASPILRLMGKNLMVMNKEERPVHHQNEIAPCSSEGASNAKYMSLLGFSSRNLPNLDGTEYHPHPSLEDSLFMGHLPNSQMPAPFPAEQNGCFPGTLLPGEGMMKADLQGQSKLDERPNSSCIYNMEKLCASRELQACLPVARAPVLDRDVIVIDDSPEHETGPSGSMQSPANNVASPLYGSHIGGARSCSSYPSQNLFQVRDLGCGVKPLFPVSCPRRNTNYARWGSASVSSGPVVPRHFVIRPHPAGQLTNTMHHSPSFQ